ncbi:glycosyltransferase family 39 protein [Streptomyces sp. NBC_01283]|uniref:ArnT family glycosyltransferase n=1 Tax=Streptomyces sp. NBC_01283 TaxID=2903812 RepID=UPI00352DEAA9|nr:glycosyltransferase family 39 protein [Streptomyces sp. NBC_01283]
MLAEPSVPLRSVRGLRLPRPRTEQAPAPYWPRLLPLLAVLACVTRIPSFRWPLWSPDEGYLAVQARMLADGGELYETVVDRKPPLVPWLYEGAFALFGDATLLPLKVLAVAAQLLTAVLLVLIARRRWGDRAGRTAGVLYLLISVGLNPEDAQAATFEVFMLPCTAAAIWCADRRRWGSAGAAVAYAFLAKQTGGAALVPVAWLLWQAGGARKDVLRLGVGLCGSVLAAAVVTNPAGFLFWTVTGSGAYASFTGSELHVLFRGLTNTALLAAACSGFIPPVVRVLRIARTGSTELWLWLASSAGAVLAGFHFFGHYYLQLTPPLALLGTAALQILPRERTLTAVSVSAGACALFLAWGMLAPRPELAHAERIAGEIRARTSPGERVLVWGIHPETYWLADRAPASRYLTAGLLTNYSGGRDGPQVGEKYAVEGAWQVFRGELAAAPPALVVDDSRGKPFAPQRVPSLRRILAAGYERVGVVDGAVIYSRPDAGRSPSAAG